MKSFTELRTIEIESILSKKGKLTREERIVIIPSPENADRDDDFGFTTTIDFFQDSKRYNPVTGDDE